MVRVIMIINQVLAALFVAVVQSVAYDPPFTEEALSHRLCFTLALGQEYFQAGLSRVMEEYVRFYNTPQKFEYLTKPYRRYDQVMKGLKSHPDLGLNLELTTSKKQGELVLTEGTASSSVQSGVLEYPVGFRSGNSDSFEVEGTMDFGFGVRFEQKDSEWKINYQAAERAEVALTKCSGSKQQCDQLKAYLETRFKQEVLLFLRPEIDFFDQPSASKLIEGFLDYFDYFGQNSIQTVHPVVSKGQGIFWFFNCAREQVSKIAAKGLKPDHLEMSFSQNFLDSVVWTETDFSVDDILAYVKRRAPDVLEQAKDYIGMVPKGRVRVTKDPLTIAQMDFSKISQKPGFKNVTGGATSSFTPGVDMDMIQINQNAFVELTDENSDLTIIPIKMNTHFRAKIRPGHKMPMGQTQEVKFELSHYEIEIMETQTIDREHQLHEFGRPYEGLAVAEKEKEDDEDEDDDFDDEEEEGESEKAASAKKISNLAMLVSSFLPVVQKEYMHLAEEWLNTRFTFYPGSFMTGLQGSRNEYYPFVHKYSHDIEFCMGMEAREPQIWVDDDRLLWSATLNKDQLPSLEYCNSEKFVKQHHPRALGIAANTTESWAKISKELFESEDTIHYIVSNQGLLTWRVNHMHSTVHFNMVWKGISPFLHYFATHKYYKDFCDQAFPGDSFINQTKSNVFHLNCPIAFSNYHEHFYDGLRRHEHDLEAQYFTWDNLDLSAAITQGLNFLSYAVVALALTLYYKSVSLSTGSLIGIVLLLNLIFSTSVLFDVTHHHGVDYPAYLQQVGAVYHGERNYTQISSSLGPCFYPAGHIWQMMPVYWIHLKSELGMYYVMAFFLLLHAMANCLTFLLADSYFKGLSGSKKVSGVAQLVALTMCLNQREIYAYADMFNDSLMAVHLMIAIYLAVNNKPLWSSLFIGLGLSVKAGIVLFLPAFLGSIQYSHGTFTLVSSLAIIVGFQLLCAWPFIASGQTSISQYLHMSQLNASGRQGDFFPEDWWNWVAAQHENTVFYYFLPKQMFYAKWQFGYPMKILMISANIWHFFIKHNCFPQCFSNLLHTFNSKAPGVVTGAQRVKTLQILVIGYMAGMIFIPGANHQFQLWYLALIPLLLSMLSLPFALTFWLPVLFYPIWRERNRSEHQVFLMVVVLWNFIQPAAVPKIKQKQQ